MYWKIHPDEALEISSETVQLLYKQFRIDSFCDNQLHYRMFMDIQPPKNRLQTNWQKKLDVTKSWLSQKAGCHKKLVVTKSWTSQKLVVTKAGCHKKLDVTKSWLSQKLVVTKAGCLKSWLSQKAGCHKSWLSGSWTSESWLSGSWLSVCPQLAVCPNTF